MQPIGIYIHVPFCLRKCDYCDFASYVCPESLRAGYAAQVCQEIGAGPGAGRQVSSVFVGGGTPTLLTAAQLLDLLEAVRRRYTLLPEAEISLEGNPGTVTAEQLSALRRGGYNRLSLGVQAAQDGLLRVLGRIHNLDQAGAAVRAAKAAGFTNLNVDLMAGLPGQRLEDLLDSVRWATAQDVTHVSLYSLIVEEGTPLWEAVAAGVVTLPTDEEERSYYHAARQALEAAGYARYEISNYARPGYACRHNLHVWRGGMYLGFGCAAASRWGNCRYRNPSTLAGYGGRQPLEEAEALYPAALAFEEVMLALRLTEGLDLTDYAARYGRPLSQTRIQRLCQEGLAQARQGRLRLTTRGLDVQNSVLLYLLDDV